MTLAPSKTKLVCTIGPASDSPEIMLQMLHAGMNIARLNFSHGDFAWHRTAIDNLRRAARTAGKRMTIMADLPGPKIRIGQLAEEPIELKRGDAFTLTTNEIIGDRHRVFVSFKLPVWIAAASPEETTCHGLQFSYGVHPVYEPEPSRDWTTFARRWVQSEGLADGLVVLTEGPSRGNPEANHRLEIIDLRLGRGWNNEPLQHVCVPDDRAKRRDPARGN